MGIKKINGLSPATCDCSVLFFNASVRVYLTVSNELPVCMNGWMKLCFTILCRFTYYGVILCSG